MRLHIIRHGDPDYKNDCLTARGKQEAEALAQRLARLPLHALFSSPMGRAQETATPSAVRLGLPVTILPWAREIGLPHPPGTQVAVWNLPPERLAASETFPGGWQNDPIFNPPHGAKAFSEISAGLVLLLAQFGIQQESGAFYAEKPLLDGDIALFCHHGLGLALLSALLGQPATALWRSFWLPPASVTTVLLEEVGGPVNPRVVTLGDAAHILAAGLPENFAGLCYNRG